jgi:uncharacterized protein YbbK (DUF523 family)
LSEDAAEVVVRKILVSECLCGTRTVRYDGADVPERDARFLKWKAEGRFVLVCPEVYGGLPTPRPAAQRVGNRVITGEGADVTAAYEKGAEEAVRLAKAHDIAFAIMKIGSPSCGSKWIYDGSFTGRKISGQGLAVQYLREAGFTVFGEDDMDAAESFLRTLE